VVEMLEFVRPVRLQMERIDVGNVLHKSVSMGEAKAPRGDVAVAVHIEPGLPMIAADEHQLLQVFTNLLANAFEALDGKGRITISATTSTIDEDPALTGRLTPTPTVVVDVIDDGPGVPAEAT